MSKKKRNRHTRTTNEGANCKKKTEVGSEKINTEETLPAPEVTEVHEQEAAASAEAAVTEPVTEPGTAAEPELSEGSAEKEKRPLFRLRGKRKYYEVTPETDIRFRGFLSYRHLKMIAWLFIVLACTGTVIELYAHTTDSEASYSTLVNILQFGKDFSVPLLLFAGYATVLNGRDNYKKVIIKNIAITLVLAGLFILIYERYVMRACTALLGSREVAEAYIENRLGSATSDGFFSFNIFIDLTLCTLVMFFINYNPKKYFQGWKICIFRGFVLLPIAYEIASVCLKILASTHVLTLPVYVFPFLTTKPPAGFLLFIFIAKYFKELRYKFNKKGKTQEDYEAYLTTNHNSFRFARYVVIMIVIVAIIDILMTILIAALHIIDTGAVDNITAERLAEALHMVEAWGFCETVDMITITPLILLFSYTKVHKNKMLDIVVPIVGVVLVAYVFADGIFGVICELVKESYAQ